MTNEEEKKIATMPRFIYTMAPDKKSELAMGGLLILVIRFGFLLHTLACFYCILDFDMDTTGTT